MTFLNHPAIATYQTNLAQLKAAGHTTETQTRAAFRRMLEKICDERSLLFVEDDANALTNPTMVIEVLSPSTEANDRGAKWRHYQHLA